MKAVIFDLGNVLVNYDGKDTFTGISDLAGVSLETLFAHYQTIDHAFGIGQLSGRDYYELIDKTFGLAVSYETFAKTFCRNQQRNEPALAFARELQARETVKVGIISNTNEIHANWLRTNLPELSHFSSVIFSNEVGFLKPDATIYRLHLPNSMYQQTKPCLWMIWRKMWRAERPFIFQAFVTQIGRLPAPSSKSGCKRNIYRKTTPTVT